MSTLSSQQFYQSQAVLTLQVIFLNFFPFLIITAFQILSCGYCLVSYSGLLVYDLICLKYLEIIIGTLLVWIIG